MNGKKTYPPGVPCWVETLQPDPRAALEFYTGLFGWDVAGPGPMPFKGGEYFVARIDGDDVAGIATLPPILGAPGAIWSTHIRVADVDACVVKAKGAGATVVAAPFNALPAGRGAVLADPAGARFGIWEALEREGAQRVNEPRAWAMSALLTSDPDGANAFYGEVFGWTPHSFGPGGDITLYRLPGYVGGKPEQPVPRDVVAVMMPIDGIEATPHWSVDFWIDDLDHAVARAQHLGATVVVPPYETPAFRQAVLQDRAGATFSISQLIV